MSVSSGESSSRTRGFDVLTFKAESGYFFHGGNYNPFPRSEATPPLQRVSVDSSDLVPRFPSSLPAVRCSIVMVRNSSYRLLLVTGEKET